jgi:hypothetical protein
MHNSKYFATAALLLIGGPSHAQILATAATVHPDDSLIVDVRVTMGNGAAHIIVTYQATMESFNRLPGGRCLAHPRLQRASCSTAAADRVRKTSPEGTVTTIATPAIQARAARLC